MRIYGLIGNPLGHSFSKKYFSEKFLNEHITDCFYENYQLISLDKLPRLIEENPDLCGFNVTIPYKSEIFSYLDMIEPEAVKIGAVNVVKIKRAEGKVKLCGYNSDITGITDTLAPFIKGHVRNAMVLGTGGASKAVCYVLDKFGLNITLISRNRKTGVLSYSDITHELIEKTDLIINTTPLGMFPNIEGKPDLDYSLLGKKHILFDLVYNPEKTAFLKSGEERGCTILTGLKMLRSQAEKAWKIWNDNDL
ncbi:MAG TPA: shikimate dehydrogenase [Bacteroidales bacterium]|nr:shikimate dehydrogenase [Bacteroidales bacterium]HPT20585.1 shikimate dehydrogenase [Bacteroidales bacterium]